MRACARPANGGSDPIFRTTCPCDGLVVASGVTLEINGTITGSAGILVEGGAAGVAVKNGKIAGFGVGVNGESLGPVFESRFTDLQMLGGGFGGFLLTGHANVIESNVIRNSLFIAILVSGDHNTVSQGSFRGAPPTRRASVAGPRPILALLSGPIGGGTMPWQRYMAPQPARERASRSQECPDFNPSGTLRPAAPTTEGRARPLRAVGKVEHGLGWRPRR